MAHKIKFLCKVILFLFVALFLFATWVNLSFEWDYTQMNASNNYIQLKDATTAIIPGAAVYGKKPSPILLDRLKSGLLLYNKKKVKKILLSGDNGNQFYNELKPMIKFMVENKVNKEDIFVDYEGYRTFDTMYRAKYIYNVTDAIIVTQKFHQPRAAYLALKVGIDASCFEADRRKYKDERYNRLREFLARTLAWFDMNFRFTTPTINANHKHPISGDGTTSWKEL
ncbi:MAG: YdcF family protein [Leptospiraceae bacterium]|nr:YdcF family protein [Leptospiraceae bacterium]MCP5493873.1 YdcF family protein [Leptospiraceae bacterium]